MRRFAEEQRREDERDGRRLLSIACRPEPDLLPHQQLVTVDLEAPPPSPDAYVDMGPVEPSHYQGLLELRQGRQQEQQQQNEEEGEEQPFAMELVSACFLYIAPFCSHAATRLCSLCLEVRLFRTESKRESEVPAFILLWTLKFICSIGE